MQSKTKPQKYETNAELGLKKGMDRYGKDAEAKGYESHQKGDHKCPHMSEGSRSSSHACLTSIDLEKKLNCIVLNIPC